MLKSQEFDFPDFRPFVVFEQLFPAGKILFLEGETCQWVGYVISGEIIIRSADPEGREVLIQRIRAEAFFGDVMLLAEEKSYLGNVIAAEPSVVAFFSPDSFLAWLKSSDVGLRRYLSGLAQKTYELKQDVKLLGLPSLRDKIWFFLAAEAKRQGSKTVVLPYDRETWADKLAVCRPSLSRELGRMQNDGWIETEPKRITLLKS